MAHFKGLHLQKLLEQKAKETTQYREKAEEGISGAEKMVLEAKKVEADVSKAEDLLGDAKNYLNNKDYSAAAEYAERALEEAKRAHATRISNLISSAENMVQLTQKIGADVSRANEYLAKAKGALDKDDLAKALEFANQSWKENEKILREHLSKSFSQAQSLIHFWKNQGNDTATAEDSLKSARDAMEGGNYEIALSLTNQCVDAVGVGVSEAVSKTIEDTKSIVSNFEGDPEAAKVNDLIAQCQKSLEKYEYEKAMNDAKRAKIEAEAAFKKVISTRITNLEKSIERADSAGTDNTKMKELLAGAKTALKSNDLKKATELLNTVKSETEDVQMQRVLNVIAQSRNSFVYAKKIGVDITAVLQNLEKARELMREAKYDEALKIATESKAEVERIVEQFQSTANEVKYIQDTIVSAEAIGISMPAMKTQLESAKAALMAKDYKKAHDLAAKCKGELDSVMYSKVMEAVEAAEGMRTIADRLGCATPESSEILDDAVSGMKAKDYKRALESAQKYRNEMKLTLRGKINDLITATEGELERVGGSSSVDIADAKELLGEAKQAVKTGDYEKGYALVMEGRKDLDEAQWREAKKIYDYVKENIDGIKKLGGDAAVPEKTLEGVLEAVEKRQFQKAAELCDRALDELRVSEKKFAEETFFAAKLAVIEVKKTGGDITALRDLLRFAKTAIESGDYKEAYKHSMKAKQEADRQKTTYEETFEAMSTAAALIAEAKKFNVDATKAIERLLAARTAFEKSDYAKAMEYAYECRDEAKRIMSRFTSAKKVITVTERIAVAEKLGFDTTKPKETLDKATGHIKTNDFVSALDLATLAESEIEELLVSSITFTITSTDGLISQARATEIDTSKSEKFIADAKEALAGKLYEDAVRAVNMARENLVKLAEFNKKVATDLKKVEERLDEAESFKIDVVIARKLYEKATEAFRAKNYSQSSGFAAKALGEIEKEQRNSIEKVMNNSLKAIENAKIKGINVSQQETLYEEAKASIGDGRFRDAFEVVSRCEQDLDKALGQHELATKAITTAQQKIDEAEKSGVSAKRSQELLKKAKELMKAGNFVQSIDTAVQAGNMASSTSTQTKSVSDILRKIDEQVRTLSKKDPSIDFSRARDYATKSQASLDENEFEIALDLANEGLKTVKKIVEDSTKGSLQRLDQLVGRCEAEGIDVSAPSNMLDTTRGQMDAGDFDKALDGLHNVDIELTRIIDRSSPKIVASIEPGKALNLEEWSEAELLLTNIGKSSAKKVGVALAGKFEIPEIGEIGEIKAKTSEKVPLRIKPLAVGDQPVSVSVKLERVFDGKSGTMEETNILKVGIRYPEVAGAQFFSTCAFCNEGVRGDQGFVRCQCGSDYHSLCTAKTLTCGRCGTPLRNSVNDALAGMISQIESVKKSFVQSGGDAHKIDAYIEKSSRAAEDSDPATAIEYLRLAALDMSRILSGLSTVIEFSLEQSSLREGEWGTAIVALRNSGDAAAKNVQLLVDGAESQPVPLIADIPKGETVSVPLKLRIAAPGNQSLALRALAQGEFDPHQKTFEARVEVPVAHSPHAASYQPPQAPAPAYQSQAQYQPAPALTADQPPSAAYYAPSPQPYAPPQAPAAPGPGPQQATAMGKCEFCLGKIKPGLPIIACECGKTYHQMCGTRAGKCKSCGRDLVQQSPAQTPPPAAAPPPQHPAPEPAQQQRSVSRDII